MDNYEFMILKEKIRVYEEALHEIKEVADTESDIFAIAYMALNHGFE